jgi:prolyl 4-hydroxylase
MVKYMRRIRTGLAVGLVLGVIIPATIFTLDDGTASGVSDYQLEASRGVSDDQLEVSRGLQGADSMKPVVTTVGADLGEPQTLGEMAAKVVRRVERARKYLQDTVMVEPRYEKVRTVCRNRNKYCALYAVKGECHKNPALMKTSCAPVCFSCEQLHEEAKCPADPNAKNAWYPGDLNRMFERLTTDPAFDQYSPKVLSRPSFVGTDTNETAGYQLGPWVLILENFVSAKEAEEIIHTGADIGYARSVEMSGGKDEAGKLLIKEVTGRTSTNAWCNELCDDDPLVTDVSNRIEMVTQIPHNNTEDLQLLRYEPGQFYKTHNDYIPGELDRVEGVRILTVFLYLSDVEEGGGTNFPVLDLTVEPKRGRALIWPSVLDEDPHQIDLRTNHQALRVIKGLKYGANAWLHHRSVVSATELGCYVSSQKAKQYQLDARRMRLLAMS